MSAEKLPFVVSTVFTIGPRVDDMDSLLLYAKVKLSNHVNELVQGVIEEVFEKVQLELNQYGLRIYNANVKTQMEASNEAKVSSSLNSGMAETVGDADASSGINPTCPPPCESHRNTEACSKCMYNKYQPEPEKEFCLPANGSHPVSVYDIQMKHWPMNFRTNGKKAYLTRGWSRFAQAKQLREGETSHFMSSGAREGQGLGSS
ncbi:hypothetical protein FH972_018802 [Carpinus fangiana]|uniref:Flotillin-like n=1 Tax=Carpinus fangiana TaxID=176857 RepID=A0A5N6RRP5_9ROSI|nr:hypothetical protein FH972_018802 [Carpinus fangiana]